MAMTLISEWGNAGDACSVWLQCFPWLLATAISKGLAQKTEEDQAFTKLVVWAGKEALILDDNNGVSCLESDVADNPVNFSGWPIECEPGRGQSRIWECHSSRKSSLC